MSQKYLLDKDWKFSQKSYTLPKVKNHSDTYLAVKSGMTKGPGAAYFDDSNWDTVQLPHDWLTSVDFDPDGNLSAGYKERGTAWYRRYFKLDKSYKNKRIFIDFEGISGKSEIYVNGFLLKRHFSSYIGTTIEITEIALFGENINSVSVFVDGNTPEGWWYEGAGIYRNVHLRVTEKLSFRKDGIHCLPQKLKDNNWSLTINSLIGNRFSDSKNIILGHQLHSNQEVIAQTEQEMTANQFASNSCTCVIENLNPDLWTLDIPNIYTVKSFIKIDGKIIDSEITTIGFRTIFFDSKKGFFLNGEPVKIKGTCNHQDHAGVGVALPNELMRWRISKLKEMGSNAYRSAHNPPPKELLDECDKQGMLVIDELRKFGTDCQSMEELEYTIRRDRNHPSIILWSIFNEEPIQGTETGERIAQTMKSKIKSMDSSRPVTAGMNGGHLEKHSAVNALDVAGINYFIDTYDEFRNLNPDKPVIGSETASTLSIRNEYKNDKSRCILSAFDENIPDWGATAENAWMPILERDYFAGTFVWTGFDYRGEPTPFSWPAVSSYFGIFDLAGFPKDNYFLYQCYWKEDPVIHIIISPYDNNIVIYSNCETIRVSFDNSAFGEFTMPENKKLFVKSNTPFKTIKAEGFINKNIVLSSSKQRHTSPKFIKIEPHKNTVVADGRDIIIVNCTITDFNSNHVINYNEDALFEISGAARIIGVGNGNPLSHHLDKSNTLPFFNGKCQCIIQSTGNTGNISFSIKSGELQTETTFNTVESSVKSPEIPAADPVEFISEWRVSPLFQEKPSPEELNISDNDMNSWEPVKITESTQKIYKTSDSWICFLAKADIVVDETDKKQIIVFEKIVGNPEVRVNGISCNDYISDKFDRRKIIDQNIEYLINNAYQIPENISRPYTITVCFNPKKFSGISSRVYFNDI